MERVWHSTPTVRWAVLALLAALALIGLERGFGPPAWPGMGPGRTAYTDTALTGVAESYRTALAQANYHLSGVNQRTATMPGDWLMHNISARAWLARARLSGAYGDFASADAAIGRAFEVADAGTGPHLTGAVLAFAMHRLPQAETYLDAVEAYAVPPDRDEQAEVTAMRGDIAFYRGDYAGALRAYDAADRLAPGTSDFRRAVYHGLTGRPDLAEDYLGRTERALQAPTRHARAKLELQRGILDLERGRLDEALAHFRKADRVFPGYWLIEEHIAEVTTLKGNLVAAERLYRDIVARTGHPEFMDALAGIAAQRGDSATRTRWTERANRAWRTRLVQFPEAAFGHAIDHCIDKGDLRCALLLAERNHRARPYGEAKVKWAQALLGNGRVVEARTLIEAALASPWRTADLHRTAADVYLKLELGGLAAEQDRLARAINPLA